MTQKYSDGTSVKAPGTVIISAAGEVDNVQSFVPVTLTTTTQSTLYYIDLSGMPLALGGSALAQTQGVVGGVVPDIKSADFFANAFGAVQSLIHSGSGSRTA